MSGTFPYPVATGSGWTCSRCNRWVNSGYEHYCQTSASPPKWINPPPLAPTPTDERIAAALERIAAALEATRED